MAVTRKQPKPAKKAAKAPKTAPAPKARKTPKARNASNTSKASTASRASTASNAPKMSGEDHADAALVTGFPSRLALDVIEALATSPGAPRVYVLVSEARAAELGHCLDSLPASARKNIVALVGTAHAMDLGLSGAEFVALGKEIRRIYHFASAADVSASATHSEQIVKGARELIEFASTCATLTKIIFCSTAFVSGDRTGTIHENDAPKDHTFRNAMEEASARAEKMLRRASESLPITILRPGVIVGAGPGEGRLTGFDACMAWILSTPRDVVLSLVPNRRHRLPLVSLDDVVRASLAIAEDPRAHGRTFHLIDPDAPTFLELAQFASNAQSGKPSGFAANILRTFSWAPGVERWLGAPRLILEVFSTPATFDAPHARELLKGATAERPLHEHIAAVVQQVGTKLREIRQATAVRAMDDPLL